MATLLQPAHQDRQLLQLSAVVLHQPPVGKVHLVAYQFRPAQSGGPRQKGVQALRGSPPARLQACVGAQAPEPRRGSPRTREGHETVADDIQEGLEALGIGQQGAPKGRAAAPRPAGIGSHGMGVPDGVLQPEQPAQVGAVHRPALAAQVVDVGFSQSPVQRPRAVAVKGAPHVREQPW